MKLSKEFKVGLFMVISITLLYFGFNFLKGIDFFSSTNKYYTVFTNVDKLTESNQIYLNGYAVGRVSDIRIQQNKDRVLVELDIDSDIVVTESSLAMLNGELLGGRFIELKINSEGRVLKAKDTIQSAVAKGLMDFFTESAEPVASNLQSTLKKLNSVLDNLALNTKRLDTVFRGLQPTPVLLNRTLANANSNISELSTSFQTVAGNLNSSLNDLKPTLENFRSLSDSLKNMEISQTINRAQQSLSKLNESLTKLNNGDNTMSKLLTEDSLYVNLNRLLNSVDSLANHFNENPRHFLSPLGKSRKKIERDLKKKD
jgi:phospholipid/cholesterol/gamma-HCH transport system substrate-binding protein